MVINFCANEFIKKYETNENCLTFVSFRKNKKKLLISFSTHHGVDRYYMNLKNIYLTKDVYDWDFLLFYNYPTDYYSKNYNIIKNKIIQIKKDYDDIYLLGSSMSGNTVVLLGLELNLNIIANVPQFNLIITYELAWESLKKTLDRVDDKDFFKIDADKLKKYLGIFDKKFIIVSGNNFLDSANNAFFGYECKKIEKDMFDKIKFIKVDSNEHKFFITFYDTNDPNIISMKDLVL